MKYTIVLTCSGVRGGREDPLGLEAAVCWGGVDGRSVIMAFKQSICCLW